ncbi:uncharacterized protein LOC142492137 [Ascaphus truei]|uniref:uncharacterized protein LOC142492135 n=1 Tax=Ascaphus truei TaxID=8439 RepID=UPI003F5A3FE8
MKINTKTFFKKVDSNSFILSTSNHKRSWIDNIPQSQFMRIRRNCSLLSDFESQSVLLFDKFIERGYDRALLTKSLAKVYDMDRESLLIQNKTKIVTEDRNIDNVIKVPFVTEYNSVSRNIQKIIGNSWNILCNDPILGPSLQSTPSFIYRRAKNLKHYLAPSDIGPPIDLQSGTTWLPVKPKGNFSCGRCKACKMLHTDRKKFISNTTKECFTVKDCISCKSTHVVYLLQCPCGYQYIGRTKRYLRIRILEHARNIKLGLEHHSVSRHFKNKHNCDSSLLKYIGIQIVNIGRRGGDRDKMLSKQESLWIYKMQTLSPLGLNEELDVWSLY